MAGLLTGRSSAQGLAGVLGAAQDAAGAYLVGEIDGGLAETARAVAPVRLHALCPRPDGREAVAVARRPGDVALVLDGAGGGLKGLFTATEGRKFSGHGVYRDAGRLFLSTEIEVASGAGVVAVRDASRGFAPLSILSSAGVGPHELVSTGRLLAVANGAKEPKSDPGVASLDRTHSLSNLALLDPVSGAVDRVAELEAGLESLSLRHLAALPGGGVLVAAQDRETEVRDRPLIARLDGAKLRWLDPDLEITPAFAAYVGSLTVDRSGRYAAASSPKGGVVAAFDLATNATVGSVAIPDVCGLAPDRAPGKFVATSGLGDMVRIAVHDGGCAVVERRAGALRWDNHLAALA